jgi:asparagine synthase (glutamine-hydrolysing)
MCGIAGIISENQRVDAEIIRRMCETMVHRGPDDEGIHVEAGCGVGMRRLSIIDVAGGHQPVFNEDRSIWTVFNGEIYNFRELRKELESCGHKFRSNSDTETIVHLYEEHGADCVQKLRGMFAIAVYDSKQRKLLLARDRLGIKPLHYAFHEGRLLFASEIKAILQAAPQLREINQPALLQYFYFGYIPDPLTAFAAIRKLPPGRILEFSNCEVNVRQYWDLPAYGTYAPRSEGECLDELEHRLEEAVSLHLISDVPLGAMLSGGVDSSTVVALMARARSSPIKTFSIGFKHGDFNEAQYAKRVAEQFATEHHEFLVEPDIADTVDTLASTLEEPFGDSSMLPTYYVSRLARQHVTVALTGDGGDEAFAGYERYAIHLHRRARYGFPDWAGRIYRKYIDPWIPGSLPGKSLAYSISLPWVERYTEAVSLEPFQRQFELLTLDFVESCSDGNLLKEFRDRLDYAPGQDPLSRVLYLDTKTYLPGDILTKVDRMSMLNSLEARVPLLDHKFIEWVTSLTPEWKMRSGRGKYIFRRLAERIGVPREVLDREKRGFSLPLVHWMRNELKEMILGILSEQQTLQRGYLNEAGIRRLLNEHFQGRRDHSARIWRFLMFELWYRNFARTTSAQDRSSGERAYSVTGGHA